MVNWITDKRLSFLNKNRHAITAILSPCWSRIMVIKTKAEMWAIKTISTKILIVKKRSKTTWEKKMIRVAGTKTQLESSLKIQPYSTRNCVTFVVHSAIRKISSAVISVVKAITFSACPLHSWKARLKTTKTSGNVWTVLSVRLATWLPILCTYSLAGCARKALTSSASSLNYLRYLYASLSARIALNANLVDRIVTLMKKTLLTRSI